MALPTACPLCHQNAARQRVVTSRVYAGEGEHAVFHCQACDLRYLYPGLSAADEMRFYAKEFESFMAKRSAAGAGWELPDSHVAANESQRVRRMAHLEPFLSRSQDILEIGCSSGFMLYPLRDKGHRCVGVEPSGVFADYVREKGLACFDSFESFKADNADARFDLILHYYVLEHIGDPLAFLKEQFELLRPGGTIVFEVPNARDALSALYDIPEYERFIWVISHRWYFSGQSLRALLARCGGDAQVGFDQRYDLSNHLIWARDGKPGGMGRFAQLLGEDVDRAYRNALVRGGYGDTLIGIIRKPI